MKFYENSKSKISAFWPQKVDFNWQFRSNFQIFASGGCPPPGPGLGAAAPKPPRLPSAPPTSPAGSWRVVGRRPSTRQPHRRGVAFRDLVVFGICGPGGAHCAKPGPNRPTGCRENRLGSFGRRTRVDDECARRRRRRWHRVWEQAKRSIKIPSNISRILEAIQKRAWIISVQRTAIIRS